MIDEFGNTRYTTTAKDNITTPTGSPSPNRTSVPSHSFIYTAPSPEVVAHVPLTEELNGETLDETFRVLPPIPSPEFASTLNFDFDTAQQCYNAAIAEHLIIKTFHDQEFAFTFDEHNFPSLDPLISFQSDYTRICFSSHINCLLEDLKAGIRAALQHELIRLLISEDLFLISIKSL